MRHGKQQEFVSASINASGYPLRVTSFTCVMSSSQEVTKKAAEAATVKIVIIQILFICFPSESKGFGLKYTGRPVLVSIVKSLLMFYDCGRILSQYFLLFGKIID